VAIVWREELNAWVFYDNHDEHDIFAYYMTEEDVLSEAAMEGMVFMYQSLKL
jgi:hypothetical protein